MSAFGMIQLIFYALTASLCVVAARSAAAKHEPADARSWRIIAGCVTILFLLQLLHFEEFIGSLMRGFLQETNVYRTRRGPQAAAAAFIVVVGLISAALFSRRTRRQRGTAQKWVGLAIIGLVGSVVLVCLRSLSLHGLDRLLYGRLHLNWVLDIGLMGLIAFSAMQYIRQAGSALALDRPRSERAKRRSRNL